MSAEKITTVPAQHDPRREWEPMRLTSIGRLGDLMRGAVGSRGDGGGTMKP